MPLNRNRGKKVSQPKPVKPVDLQKMLIEKIYNNNDIWNFLRANVGVNIHMEYNGQEPINSKEPINSEEPQIPYNHEKPLDLAIKLKKFNIVNTLLGAHHHPELVQQKYGFDELDPALDFVVSLKDKTPRDVYFIEILRLLGASRDRKNENPLIRSALKGDYEGVRKLLDEGCSPNITNSAGETPLHLAILGGYNQVAYDLINHQETDVNLVDDQGYAPLHLAIKAGKNELAKALINHKNINVNLVLKGELPKDGSTDATSALDDSPLVLAIDHGNTELIGALIKHKEILPDAEDQLSNTALHYAIKNSCKENQHNKVLGQEPAPVSGIFNTSEFLKFINHEKTDINKADRNGDTPFHLVIKELSENQKEDKNEYKTEMKSALDNLALNIINHPEFKITKNKKDGKTPLQLAQTLNKEDNHSLIQLLESAEFQEFKDYLDGILKPEQLNDEEKDTRTKKLENIQKLITDDFYPYNSNSNDIPYKFICTIGLGVMTDPIKISGDTCETYFNRDIITEWIETREKSPEGIATHPLNRKKIINKTDIEPLTGLKKEIDDWKTSILINALIESFHLGVPSKIAFQKAKIFIKDDSELRQKVMERAIEIKNTRQEQNPPTTTPAATSLGTSPRQSPRQQ